MGFEGGDAKKLAFERSHTKKIKEKERGHVKYLRKTLKSQNVLIQKNCYRTNLVHRIQIYHKFSFCFNITLDIVFILLPLSFIDFLWFTFFVSRTFAERHQKWWMDFFSV